MPIIPLLQGRAFGPEDIKVMSTAFEGALNALGLMDRADPLNELVAGIAQKLCFFPPALGYRNRSPKLCFFCSPPFETDWISGWRGVLSQNLILKSPSDLQMTTTQWLI